MENNKKVLEILKRLRKLYPAPVTALDFKTPFEILTATILSAQATDATVNRVTKPLFKNYRSIKAYASAPIGELQKHVSSINYYKTKAKNIKTCAEIIISRHKSKVPQTMAELVELPGVARKTANIVLSSAYGIVDGIAVDTHVKRVSFRLGLTKHTDPVKIEQDLMAIAPRKHWADISNLLIFHGRNTCPARTPRHEECVLYDICPQKAFNPNYTFKTKTAQNL